MIRSLLLVALASSALSFGSQPPQKSLGDLSDNARASLCKSLENEENLKHCAKACREFYGKLIENNTSFESCFKDVLKAWKKEYPQNQAIAQAIYLFHKRNSNQQKQNENIAHAFEIKKTIKEIRKVQE